MHACDGTCSSIWGKCVILWYFCYFTHTQHNTTITVPLSHLVCVSTLAHVWVLYKLLFTVSCHLYGHLVQDGRNAMHVAAAGGHIEVIKFLLPYFGARILKKTKNSYTMLHCVAQEGHSQVARYLIDEVQMDPQDRDKVCGCQGVQGLHHASCMHICVNLICAVKYVIKRCHLDMHVSLMC